MEKVKYHDLVNIITDIFVSNGLSKQDSEIIADSLVSAKARGVNSHGLQLLPVYIERIKRGGINKNYQIKEISDFGSMVVLDGDAGPGQAIGMKSLELAMNLATNFGMGCVTVKNSNHIGMLAYFGKKANENGLISVIMTNTGASVAAWGGNHRILGNNAICISAPGIEKQFVLDMAIGKVACGKIREANTKNEVIPSGWLLNNKGNSTINPNDLDEGGAVLPFGEHKGFGLGIAIDILTGILSDGKTSLDVTRQRAAFDQATGCSQTYLLFDTKKFGDKRGNLDNLLNKIKHSSPESRILIPGEPEDEKYNDAIAKGIDLTEKENHLIKKYVKEGSSV